MTRLSVTSSNSLRRSSPSARKRAQSMGRLGELVEGDTYQYEELGQDNHKNAENSTLWQDRVRQVRSESGSPQLVPKKSATLPPNGALPRAKSTHEMSMPVVGEPACLPRGPPSTPPGGRGTGHYTGREVAGLNNVPQQHRIGNQRPVSCLYSPHTPGQQSGVNLRVKSTVNHLPDLLASSKDTPRRPHSSYDLKVSLPLCV